MSLPRAKDHLLFFILSVIIVFAMYIYIQFWNSMTCSPIASHKMLLSLVRAVVLCVMENPTKNAMSVLSKSLITGIQTWKKKKKTNVKMILLFLKKTVRGLYYFLSFLAGKGFMKILVYCLVWNLSLDKLWNLCSYYHGQVEKTIYFFFNLSRDFLQRPYLWWSERKKTKIRLWHETSKT